MDSSSRSFELLLRAIHEVEWSLPGPALNIEAVYADDEQLYFAYPPPKHDAFTPTGLRDPGLGNTGPLEFTDLWELRVCPSPRHGAQSEEYLVKFACLPARVAAIPGVRIGEDGIVLRRAAA
jgi:hypothetical protein